MSRRLTASLAIAIAVAVVGCAGSSTSTAPTTSLAAVAAGPSAAPSAVPSVSASPRPSPTDGGTQVATSNPPPTVAPTLPPPIPARWKSYKSKRYHYRIDYPPPWVVTPGKAQFADQYDGYGYAHVYVSRDDTPGQISMSRTVSSEIAYNKSHYKARLVSNKAIKLAGWSGRSLTFTGKQNGYGVTIRQIVLAKGHIGYFIWMNGLTTTADSDGFVFKKMYRTFKPT
jgi:hypothetical protein